MKNIVPFLFFTFFIVQGSAQDFTGQWKGEFIDKSTSFSGWGGDRCQYVLEIECKGTNVSGYSYTYFTDGGKRYYTICKLKGTLNKASKYLEVKEIERTKTNVPSNIRNCFQIHRLTYFKQADEQTLEGNWIPAPDQVGDCGFGTTALSRRILQKNPAYYNKAVTKNNKPKSPVPVVKAKPTQPIPSPVVKNKPKPSNPPTIAKNKPKQAVPATVGKTIPEIKNAPTAQSPDIVKNNNPSNELSNPQIQIKEPAEKKTITTRYEKRNNDLLKTIEIENETFNVYLYDNGEVDGDSISLFFNGKLLLSHKRLSEKPISLQLVVDDTRDINELIMYAENLGTIPPNTALMIVTDGDNRYEVRISSDLQKSGAIRFVHRPKNRQ